ncbi:hypothetical protein R6Q59_019050 [Mikania micrantha]
MKSMIISINVLVVVATQAKAEIIDDVISINGTVPCSLNATDALHVTPPFPNALVEVQCGRLMCVRAIDITNLKGKLSMLMSPTLMSVLSLVTSCKAVVVTPLSTCNPTLPYVTGALHAPLHFVGNTSIGQFNIMNVEAGTFVSALY